MATSRPPHLEDGDGPVKMATGQDKVREASARIEEIDAASLVDALASEAAPSC